MSGSRILQCTCTSKEQDEWYGYGWRVHNMNAETTKRRIAATCTVCGNKKYGYEVELTKEQYTREGFGWWS